MSVSTEQVKELIIELGCRSNFQIKNITEFMLPKSKEAIYLHSEGGHPKIIIRPIFEVFNDDFAALDGVARIDGFFHSSEMTRFPTRIFKSAKPIHYGLAYKITSREGADAFITKLVNTISQ